MNNNNNASCDNQPFHEDNITSKTPTRTGATAMNNKEDKNVGGCINLSKPAAKAQNKICKFVHCCCFCTWHTTHISFFLTSQNLLSEMERTQF